MIQKKKVFNTDVEGLEIQTVTSSGSKLWLAFHVLEYCVLGADEAEMFQKPNVDLNFCISHRLNQKYQHFYCN